MYCRGSSIYYVYYSDIHVFVMEVVYIMCITGISTYCRGSSIYYVYYSDIHVFVVEVVYIMCITGISMYCRGSNIYYVFYRDFHVLLPDSCLTHSPQNVPPVMLTS